MRTEGAVGEVHPTYTLIMAARWLKVPPWELARQPTYWREWTFTAMAAEQAIHEMSK